jgi:hypothetical protein
MTCREEVKPLSLASKCPRRNINLKSNSQKTSFAKANQSVLNEGIILVGVSPERSSRLSQCNIIYINLSRC